MSFSYIICHRNTNLDRNRNLVTTVNYIHQLFPDVEIIISEQGYKPTLDLSYVKTVLLEKDGLFHKTKLLNLGFKAISNRKFIIGDNDVIVSKNGIMRSIELLDSNGSVSPYYSISDVDEEHTKKFSETIDINILTSKKFNNRIGTVFAGGAVAFTKDSYIEIGGSDEEMVGWGAEDNVLSYKIERILKHSHVKTEAYHLNHSRSINDTPANPNYNANCTFMKDLCSLSHTDLIRYTKYKGSKLND